MPGRKVGWIGNTDLVGRHWEFIQIIDGARQESALVKWVCAEFSTCSCQSLLKLSGAGLSRVSTGKGKAWHLAGYP